MYLNSLALISLDIAKVTWHGLQFALVCELSFGAKLIVVNFALCFFEFHPLEFTFYIVCYCALDFHYLSDFVNCCVAPFLGMASGGGDRNFALVAASKKTETRLVLDRNLV